MGHTVCEVLKLAFMRTQWHRHVPALIRIFCATAKKEKRTQRTLVHVWTTTSTVCICMHQGQHWQSHFCSSCAVVLGGQPAIASHWEVLVGRLASLWKPGQKSTLSGPTVSQGRIPLRWEDTVEESGEGEEQGRKRVNGDSEWEAVRGKNGLLIGERNEGEEIFSRSSFSSRISAPLLGVNGINGSCHAAI